MTRWMTLRGPKALAIAMLGIAAVSAVVLQAQARSVDQLRIALADRYSIAPIQGGVALVPKGVSTGFRIVEVVDGVIAVDGDRLTGAELRDRLGRDAELVLQVSYLDSADLAELAAPGSANQNGEPAVSAPPPDSVARTQIRNGDLVRIGGDVTVSRDERVDGDVVAVLGSADIDGEVDGEVTVVMGSLTLGPNAVVRRDVHVVGGSLERSEGARVLGSVEEVGIGPGRIRRGRGFALPDVFGTFWSRVGNVAGTVLRATLMILFALVVVALGRGPVERIADRTNSDLVRSGLVGLLAELLFIPLLVVVVVVLAVSIVGIPLLVLVPFGVVAVGVLMVVGFTGLAYQIGRRVNDRFGWPSGNEYLVVTVGVVGIMAVTIVARLASLGIGAFVGGPVAALGYLVEYVAWTVGFGATLLVWFGARRVPPSTSGPGAVPPPLPTT